MKTERTLPLFTIEEGKMWDIIESSNCALGKLQELFAEGFPPGSNQQACYLQVMGKAILELSEKIEDVQYNLEKHIRMEH